MYPLAFLLGENMKAFILTVFIFGLLIGSVIGIIVTNAVVVSAQNHTLDELIKTRKQEVDSLRAKTQKTSDPVSSCSINNTRGCIYIS